MNTSLVTAEILAGSGRSPRVPFSIQLNDGSLVEVKQLLRVFPGRRVVGVGQWNGRPILAKIFVSPRSTQEALAEWNGISLLVQAGVTTPEPLALLSALGGGHVLVAEYLHEAERLSDLLQRIGTVRNSGIDSAGQWLGLVFRLLGMMHAHGLVHGDPHFGNFLWARGRLYVVDGDSVQRVDDSRSWPAMAIKNLSLLAAQLPMGWDALTGPLVATYTEMSGIDVPLQCFLAETGRLRARRLRRFIDKSVRDCTEFSVKKTWRRFVSVRRSDAARFTALTECTDKFIRADRLIKDGATSSVSRVNFDGQELVVKRYNIKGLGHALSRCWRNSRAWHSWRAAHCLIEMGIDTPRPLALVEERLGPMRGRAYFMTEFCPGVPLIEHLSRECEPTQIFAEALSELFSRLAGARITHGDLKASNLLWYEGRIVVIDLDALRLHRTDAAYCRAWKRDRRRFLRNWPESSILHQWLSKALPPPT